VRIIFPEKSGLPVGEVDNAMVGDGDPVCIASQVLQNMLWTAEWPFGIDDPVLAKQRTEIGAEGLRWPIVLTLPGSKVLLSGRPV